MNRYKFKEGEVVYHVENLQQKMIISKILRQKKLVPTEEKDETTGGFKKVDKVFLIGIECYWWDKDGKYQKQKFHSKMLIPDHIVKMGMTSIKAFTDS